MPGVLITDHWTAANGTAWDTSKWSTVRAVRGTGSATTTSNTGRIVTGSGAECIFVCALSGTYADCDITVKWQAVTFGGTTFPNPGMYPQICWRFNTNVDTGDLPRDGYAVELLPMRQRINVIKLYSSGVGGAGASFDVLGTVDLVPIDDLAPHWLRIRVKGDRHQAKWWHTDGGELAAWNIDVTDSTYTSGRMLFQTFNDDTHAAIELAYDDFRFAEILPAEPGIVLPDGTVTAAYVGVDAVVAVYVGAANVPVP